MKDKIIYIKDENYTIWVCSIEKKFYIQMKNEEIGKVGFSSAVDAKNEAVK